MAWAGSTGQGRRFAQWIAGPAGRDVAGPSGRRGPSRRPAGRAAPRPPANAALNRGKAWDEPSGPDALGRGPLQRLCGASDDWLFLGAFDADLARLDALPGLSAIAGLRGADLEAALAARFAASPATAWVSRLTAAGIGPQPVISATRLMQDPWVIAHGLSVTREHTNGERITSDRPLELSRTPVIPAAGLGAGRGRRGDPRGHRPGESAR